MTTKMNARIANFRVAVAATATTVIPCLTRNPVRHARRNRSTYDGGFVSRYAGRIFNWIPACARMTARCCAAAATAVTVALLLSPVTAHADCERMWKVGALLANAAGAEVTLHTERRERVTIPARWLRALNIVHEKIDAASGVATTLYFCAAREPNAFAWHGGGKNVALTAGMYRLLGDDWHAYATLLGHENTHLVKQHGKHRQKREVGLSLGKTALELLLAKKGGGIIELTALGIAALGASYSRDEEREADRGGMVYADCAGFSPDGALRLHEKLDSAGNFLSSHPSSRQRITALRKAITAQRRDRRCD